MKQIFYLICIMTLNTSLCFAQNSIRRNTKTNAYSQSSVNYSNVSPSKSNKNKRISSKLQSKENVNFANNGVHINTNQSVDLGLSSGTIWAAWNLGANSPEENGDYYSWGSIYSNKNMVNIGDYQKPDLANIIYSEFDVASKKWSNGWHLPTRKQLEELKDQCTWKWTRYRKVYGYSVEGPNGNAIFLPASGFIAEDGLHGKGVSKSYWSGILSGEISSEDINYCSYLGFNSVDVCVSRHPVYMATSIRCVK